MPVLTLGDERRINVFFRLAEPDVIAGVRTGRPPAPTQPPVPAQPTQDMSPREVFLALRDLRNRW
jgi:hypothetical protein